MRGKGMKEGKSDGNDEQNDTNCQINGCRTCPDY